jgi:hypothetical protein
MNEVDDDDPIVAEVRRLREEYLASFGYDTKRIDEEIQRSQLARGRKLVSYDKKDANRGH